MHTTTTPASSGREQSRLYASEDEFAAARERLAARMAVRPASPPQDQPQAAQEPCPAPAAPPPPLLPPPDSTARAHGRAWRRGSRFPGPDDFRRLDRNDRARVWVAAQALDRRTHTRGKHGGILGHTGLAVLRCLLFDFLHLPTGRLDPSYDAIAARANLARSTVIEAVGRLVAAGILEIGRRIVREWVRLRGGGRALRTRQTSNAYRVNHPTIDRGRLGDLAVLPRLGGAESGSRAETQWDQLTNRQPKASKFCPICTDSAARPGSRTADPGRKELE